MLVLIGYTQVRRDPRFYRQEAQYVHPVLWWLFGMSFALFLIVLVEPFVVAAFGLHSVNLTALFVVVVVYISVTMLGVVGSLLVARRRLNRSAQTRQDSEQS
jgi:hypothetical protein